MNILSRDPPEFPGSWSCAWGVDAYGYWQGLMLNGVRQVMRWIPPGEFMMGSEGVAEREDRELQHQVTLTRGFWLADAACTQALWQAVMGQNPSHFKDSPQQPVEKISWNDCSDFFQRANELLNVELTLRFPTEAEWEYACRAGTQTAFSWGNGLTVEQANYNGKYTYAGGKKGRYRQRTVEVLEFQPNPWGLFQMHGNVWEWCADWYGDYSDAEDINPVGPDQGRRRVLRGGSWLSYGRFLRSALRFASSPDSRNLNYGLRLAGG